jgi:hypothetical protein
VFGSDVWRLTESAAIVPRLSQEAIDSWLYYGYNCTDTSLFEDFVRLAPGAVTTVDQYQVTSVSYLKRWQRLGHITSDEAADFIHANVQEATSTLLSGVGRVTCPLSGGYDSRYLAAILAAQHNCECDAITVATSSGERIAATEVASRLGLHLETVEVRGSVWDIFSEPFLFLPDGFPITKQVSILAAERRPGVPVVSGFLGDNLVRASHNTCFGRTEIEFNTDLAIVLRDYHKSPRTDLLSPSVMSRVRERALIPMRKAVQNGAELQKIFVWADLFCRQRHYIANIFVQHIPFSEAILPFMNADLITFFMEHEADAFNRSTFQQIFERNFPTIASVPHSSQLEGLAVQRSPASSAGRRYRRVLLRKLWRQSGSVRLLPVLTRLALASLAPAKFEYLVFQLYGLHLLETRLACSGLHVDWQLS